MLRANVLCHPWSTGDDGIDEALALVQGELGATGIVLMAGCAPTDRLVATPGQGFRRVRSRGGLFFDPDETQYANTRCKPLKSDRLRARTSVAAWTEACRRRGLACRIALSTMRLGRMAGRYPEAAVKNALGEPSPAQLCPSNPDGIELVSGLVQDLLEHYSPEAIELRDFDRGRRGQSVEGLECSVVPGDVSDELMSLCFCESCRQGARDVGVDADAAARTAETALRHLFAAEPFEETLANLAHPDAALGPYMAWQVRALVSGLKTVRRRCHGHLVLHRRGDEIPEMDDLGALASHVTAVCVSHRAADGAGARSALAAVRDRCAAAQATFVELSLVGGPGSNPQAIVTATTEVVTESVNDVTFADLDMLSAPLTRVVKQAIRYARRSVGA